MRLELYPEARAELRSAAFWYDERRPGLGDEFIADVDRARVAEELLSSLEESDEEVATAWVAELERRSRDVAEGRVQRTSVSGAEPRQAARPST